MLDTDLHNYMILFMFNLLHDSQYFLPDQTFLLSASPLVISKNQDVD